MNFSELRKGEFKEVLDALEEAFGATGTDYYMIGAVARDIWYARGNKSFRRTKDIDFAVLIGNETGYLSVKAYLANHKSFVGLKNNAFAMITPAGIQVDILPFGQIEIDDGVSIHGAGLTSIKVNGFMEVYQSGTEPVELEPGHNFKVATLPSIILLKLIAYDDRPEYRAKDVRDIANIIQHYFDLQADLIYEKHADLFLQDTDPSLEEISASVIGREIKKICGNNQPLLLRIQTILQAHTAGKYKKLFIRNMASETNWTEEKSIRVLMSMLHSVSDLT